MPMKRIDTRIKVQPSDKAYPKIRELAEKKEWSLPQVGAHLFDVALGLKGKKAK